jgi:hypothetical protein
MINEIFDNEYFININNTFQIKFCLLSTIFHFFKDEPKIIKESLHIYNQKRFERKFGC